MPVGPYETFAKCVAAQIEIYRKKHPDWTLEHLKEVAGGVCYKIEQNMQGEDIQQGQVFRYLASCVGTFEFQGKHFAKFRIIDTSVSAPSEPTGERWRATYEGLKNALKSLAHHFLVGSPSEGHKSTEVKGIPVHWSMPDGYADVTYEITDEEAWQELKGGNWYAVSPQVYATKVHKGPLGEAVLDDFVFDHVAFVDKGAFANAHLVNMWDAEAVHRLSAELADGHSSENPQTERGSSWLMADGAATLPILGRQAADQIEDRRGDSMSTNQTFTGADAWDTADAPDKFFAYVPDEAKGENGQKSLRKFPLASTAKHDYDEAIVRNALARFPQANLPSGAKAAVLAKIKSIARSLGIEVSDEKGEGELANENENPPSEEATKEDMKVLKDEITRLQGEVAREKQAREIAEHRESPVSKSYQAEHDRMKKELTELKEREAQRIAETHMAEVKEVVDLRIEAGFADANDRANEILRVKEFNAQALGQMKDDLTAFLLSAESTGPKAQFVASKAPDLESAVRQRMGLPKLEAKKQ